MKKLLFVSSLAVLLMAACSNDKKETATGDIKKDPSTAMIDTAGMDPAWVSYMTPSEVHQTLAKNDGKWDAEISFYYNIDSPSVNKVSCENKMILGGRYQQSVYEGKIEGMPFAGISTLAYDNARKVYISTWIDNMGTGMMYLEGSLDAANQTLVMTGKAVDVTTGKDIQVLETLKIIDKDTQLIEMFDSKDGKETKTMSIVLKRR